MDFVVSIDFNLISCLVPLFQSLSFCLVTGRLWTCVAVPILALTLGRLILETLSMLPHPHPRPWAQGYESLFIWLFLYPVPWPCLESHSWHSSVQTLGFWSTETSHIDRTHWSVYLFDREVTRSWVRNFQVPFVGFHCVVITLCDPERDCIDFIGCSLCILLTVANRIVFLHCSLVSRFKCLWCAECNLTLKEDMNVSAGETMT